MNFRIDFAHQSLADISSKSQIGEIVINDFCENFNAPLCYWSKIDYIKHWKIGLERICNNHKNSCLITSMLEPCDANFIEIWSLYLEIDIVYIQNHLLFLEDLSKPFDESNPFESICPREKVNDEGDKVSEWNVSVNDIKEYLHVFSDMYGL